MLKIILWKHCFGRDKKVNGKVYTNFQTPVIFLKVYKTQICWHPSKLAFVNFNFQAQIKQLSFSNLQKKLPQMRYQLLTENVTSETQSLNSSSLERRSVKIWKTK